MPVKISAIISLNICFYGAKWAQHSRTVQLIRYTTVCFDYYTSIDYCTIRRREASSLSMPKHSQERETTLPIFLGTLIHSKTRKREFVDYMFVLGLSISYDRLLEISTLLGDRICNAANAKRQHFNAPHLVTALCSTMQWLTFLFSRTKSLFLIVCYIYNTYQYEFRKKLVKYYHVFSLSKQLMHHSCWAIYIIPHCSKWYYFKRSHLLIKKRYVFDSKFI